MPLWRIWSFKVFDYLDQGCPNLFLEGHRPAEFMLCSICTRKFKILSYQYEHLIEKRSRVRVPTRNLGGIETTLTSESNIAAPCINKRETVVICFLLALMFVCVSNSVVHTVPSNIYVWTWYYGFICANVHILCVFNQPVLLTMDVFLVFWLLYCGIIPSSNIWLPRSIECRKCSSNPNYCKRTWTS